MAISASGTAAISQYLNGSLRRKAKFDNANIHKKEKQV